jgi:hypothetical protein
MGERSCSREANLRILAAVFAAGAALLVTLAVLIAFPRSAEALPSFARQTGQRCGACHTDQPGLTPFGRRFKLGGYTLGGGEYRTTPFPDGSDKSEGKGWVPPIAMMAIPGYTHTQAPLPPPTSPYFPNDNVVVDPFSVFYAGAITEHIGAFAQVTLSAPPPGGLPPFGHRLGWDSVDVRYANTGKLGNLDFIYGITANNNPTLQDVWNTTPAWTFPYAVSNVAPTPATKTIIDGTFAAHVASVGAYVFINDMLYLETTGYHTLDFRAQNDLGVDPFEAPGLLDGVAPYWRVAFEPHWGKHWLMVGTFGMFSAINPWSAPEMNASTFPLTDKFTDIGFDTQYQYQGENYWFTLRGSYIHEHQKLDASSVFSGTNPTDELNTLRLQASFAYGGDNRIVLTGQYFNTWGTSDPGRYADLAGCSTATTACVPDSNGWIAEIAYIPFMTSASPVWPWFNARVGLQYTFYNKFDGTTIGAHDNNTLFLYAWLAW